MESNLLNDLEDLDGFSEAEEEANFNDEVDDNGDSLMEENDNKPDTKDFISSLFTKHKKSASTVLGKLTSSKHYLDLMKRIESATLNNESSTYTLTTIGTIEEHPEYKTVLQANTLSFEIDDEILKISKFIRDSYAAKFPELEQLVPSPLEYANCVKAIGNEMDMSKVDLAKKTNLPKAVIVMITMTATTTVGKPLEETTLKEVVDAVDLIMELEDSQKKIQDFVGSRMNLIAPNLSSIIGSTTAAKLMAVAGGLTALTKMPAGNFEHLGKTQKTNTGLSALGQEKHVGLIYYSDLCQRVVPEYRKKAGKIIAAKCALACRCDKSRSYPDGSMGKKLREEIAKRIDHMLEPPPGQSVKVLPVPAEEYKKKRGGKRVSKQKEGLAVTELRKQQNRVVFGKAEEEVETSWGSSVGLGLIGQQNGKVRVTGADNRVKVHTTKKQKAMLAHTSNVSGLSSSFAFTPVQALELGNPDLQNQKQKKQKLDEINAKWFANN
ncbi:U4/U6-U5 snRNP complex subunit prp31 [Clydaea vesicula]|uniref:U4/U6-U5 snRNP complex subunit prp31 n=1 Tax=Clydaea vesicula TaxID=447962 RepID=A0AAD5U5G0_9FUNG|nr:U4/U6-U5 snRNP complex subunit prp31 [Clydaea vesicula]